MQINKYGRIVSFSASRITNTCALTFLTEKGDESAVGDLALTYTALANIFPGFLREAQPGESVAVQVISSTGPGEVRQVGLSVDPARIMDQEVFWWIDSERPQILGGICPVTPQTRVQYEHWREEYETDQSMEKEKNHGSAECS